MGIDYYYKKGKEFSTSNMINCILQLFDMNLFKIYSQFEIYNLPIFNSCVEEGTEKRVYLEGHFTKILYLVHSCFWDCLQNVKYASIRVTIFPDEF